MKFAANATEAFSEVARYEAEGWAFIHPFDDPLVIAGQGSIGLEILEDVPHVTDVIVSVGGGGLAGGVSTAIKSLKPTVHIWGVETEGADCMSKSIAAGEIVTLDAITSVARTLGAPAPSERTFAMAKQLLEGITVVPDGEALKELRFLLERLKVLTEPAASCTLAAAERLREYFSAERHVVLVLCGAAIYPSEDIPNRVLSSDLDAAAGAREVLLCSQKKHGNTRQDHGKAGNFPQVSGSPKKSFAHRTVHR